MEAPPSAPQFLIIDNNRDTGELLARSLRRKYPLAVVRYCDEATVAVELVARHPWNVVVLHRAFDADAVHLVHALRATHATVPIVVVSAVDRSEAVLSAGANGFLNFEQWLLLGSTVANLLLPPSVPQA